MTDNSENPTEIFVAVRVGESWRVVDTRNGEPVASGPLTELEAIDLAALLNNMAKGIQSDRPDRPV